MERGVGCVVLVVTPQSSFGLLGQFLLHRPATTNRQSFAAFGVWPVHATPRRASSERCQLAGSNARLLHHMAKPYGVVVGSKSKVPRDKLNKG